MRHVFGEYLKVYKDRVTEGNILDKDPPQIFTIPKGIYVDLI